MKRITVKSTDIVGTLILLIPQTWETRSRGMYVNGIYWPESQITNWDEALEIKKAQAQSTRNAKREPTVEKPQLERKSIEHRIADTAGFGMTLGIVLYMVGASLYHWKTVVRVFFPGLLD
jgi:hypothetical protein